MLRFIEIVKRSSLLNVKRSSILDINRIPIKYGVLMDLKCVKENTFPAV